MGKGRSARAPSGGFRAARLGALSHSPSGVFLAAFLFAAAAGCGKGGGTADSVSAIFTREGLDNVRTAVELYRREFGEYPASLEELLARKGIENRGLIRDGWGRRYFYELSGGGYTLFSAGSDGKPHTGDDIRRAP